MEATQMEKTKLWRVWFCNFKRKAFFKLFYLKNLVLLCFFLIRLKTPTYLKSPIARKRNSIGMIQLP
jgi:hypothetical protein